MGLVPVASRSAPINDGFFVRWAVICLYKLLSIQWLQLQRLFKRRGPVIFITQKVCVKSTYFTSLAEASAMRFVRENTTVPVPEVYSAFEHKGQAYIVMECIDGEMLSRGWYQRSAESQSRILTSLRDMVLQIRRIPARIGCGVSNVDGGPIYDQRLPGPKKPGWGPFATIDDFHRHLRGDVDEPEYEGVPLPGFSSLLAFHQRSWPSPVFSHGDLSSLNILARGDDVVGIVDWETAAWMPQYWEYTNAWNVNPQNQFWQAEVNKFLEPFPEALEMEEIRRKYNGDY